MYTLQQVACTGVKRDFAFLASEHEGET